MKEACPSPKSREHLKSLTYEEVMSHVTWMTLRRRGVLARDNQLVGNQLITTLPFFEGDSS
jgi:hypothetical protein